MKKELGIHPYVFPMPVLLIATYNEDGSVNVMNMAWGGACGNEYVALNIDDDHKTAINILNRKAFTLAIADLPHIKEADFFGIATGNTMKDKFERSGLHAVKSSRVDAPIIEEFPVTLECEYAGRDEHNFCNRYLGKIINVLADEKVLDEKGKVDASKLQALVFDQFRNDYYVVGEKVGAAWKTGVPLMKK